MASTPLGETALASLLGDQARVRVRNATAPEDATVIVAVALARHDGGGNVGADAEFGLELAAGEEALFDPLPPSVIGPDLIEVLLRVRVDAGSPADTEGGGAVFDIYLQAGAAGAGLPARGFDVGLRRHDGELEPDEQLVPRFPDFASFARAVR